MIVVILIQVRKMSNDYLIADRECLCNIILKWGPWCNMHRTTYHKVRTFLFIPLPTPTRTYFHKAKLLSRQFVAFTLFLNIDTWSQLTSQTFPYINIFLRSLSFHRVNALAPRPTQARCKSEPAARPCGVCASPPCIGEHVPGHAQCLTPPGEALCAWGGARSPPHTVPRCSSPPVS